jgi:hypothetical protein
MLNKLPEILKFSVNRRWVILVLLAVFVFSRVSFWVYLPYPDLNEDSLEHLFLAFQITEGKAPTAHFIGLGYPILFYLYSLFFDGFTGFFMIQSVFTLVSVLVFVLSFNKKGKIPILIFIPCFFYLFSDHCIRWEMNYTPDSVISSCMVLMAGLFNFYQGQKPKFWIISGIGFLSVFLISMRSSNLSLLAVLFFMLLFLLLKRHSFSGFFLIFLVFAGTIALSTYNYFFSKDNKFSAITYGRLATDVDSNHVLIYKEGFQTNASAVLVKKPNPVKHDFSPIFLNWINSMPQNTHVWRHFFSLNPHERTRSALDSRYLKVKAYPIGPEVLCIGIPSINDCEIQYGVPYGSVERWADSTNSFQGNRHPYFTFALNFLTYSFNLSYPQGKIYHGAINHNFKYSGSKTLDPLRGLYVHQKWKGFADYVWGNSTVQENQALGIAKSKIGNHPVIKWAPLFTQIPSVLFYSTFYSLLFFLIVLCSPFILFFLRHNPVFPQFTLVLIFFVSHAGLFSLFGVLPRYSSVTEPFQFFLPFILMLALISKTEPRSVRFTNASA